MNGAHAILNGLIKHDIDTIFGYPGGAIMPFYDALAEQTPSAKKTTETTTYIDKKQHFTPSAVRHILCRHEQACALAADGFARRSGKIGVCVATSGPGATNLITGVANAFLDSIPLLIITGQVPAPLVGTDAFQEVDVLGMSLGVVKHSYMITDANSVPTVIDEAIKLACSGRPGPVWIDITKDALQQKIELHTLTAANQAAEDSNANKPIINAEALEKARTLLQQAKRPLLYSGGGVRLANAVESLRHFSEITGLPSVVSLHGIGNMGSDDPLHLGMLGMHGSVAANEAVNNADLLICVGARFDDRATGNLAGFAPNAKVIHLDIDHAEIHKRRYADVAFLGHLSETLNALACPLEIQEWQTACKQASQHTNTRAHADHPKHGHQNNGAPTKYKQTEHPTKSATYKSIISGPEFLKQLSRASPKNTAYTCDVGQHVNFDHPRLHLSSGGLGTMGFGIPAAIGAQLAAPNQLVIAVCGDGSFQMNIQELATIKRYDLPIKMVLMDNQVLGMVRQQQELFFNGRFSEIDLSDNPDFCALTQAYGIPTTKITTESEVSEAVAWLIQEKGPALLHVCLSEKENVWPMVKPGAANTDYLLEANRD